MPTTTAPAAESGLPGNAADLIVVGGGIIGLAIAYRQAQLGMSVTVIDASGTRGATWAAAGMLAPISEASFGEDELTRLNLAAVGEFRRLADELGERTGEAVHLRTEGTLAVAGNVDDRAALDRLTEFRSQLGLKSQTLTSREVRRLEPFLAADVRGGVLALDDLSVDNRQYAGVLRLACDELSVAFVTDEVRAVSRSAGRVDGVHTVSGATYGAQTVILCAGALTKVLVDVPVEPVKGQILRLAVPERLTEAGPILTHTVRGMVRGSEVYLVPRANGEVVVGATSEQRGMDTTVTAGGVYELLRNAYELLPISSEFTFVEARAGLRPGTPDNAPILGWLEDGLAVATGHYRNGILLSASTSTAVSRLLAGRPLAPEWEPFGTDRFSATSEPARAGRPSYAT